MKKLAILIFLVNTIIICDAQIQKMDIYSDGTLLNAYIYQTEGTGQPTLIWCHGNPGMKENGESKFAVALNKLGINVLRFNYRGLWDTPGIYKLSNSIEDLANVLDHIYKPEIITKHKIDTNQIFVGGYSFGTHVVLVSALDNQRIKNIYCQGIADHNYFYFTPKSLDPNNVKQWRELLPSVNEVLWGSEPKFDEIYNPFNTDILKNTYEFDFVSNAEKLKDKKIFIVVGLNDLTVPIEFNFLPFHRKLVKMNHENYTYKILESDHYFRNVSVGERAQLIADWINN